MEQTFSYIRQVVVEQLRLDDWTIKYYLNTDDICNLVAMMYLSASFQDVRAIAMDFDTFSSSKMPLARISFVWTCYKLAIIITGRTYGMVDFDDEQLFIITDSIEEDIQRILTIIELAFSGI